MADIRLDPAKVKWRIVDGEVLAMDLVNDRYFAVNATGAVLWECLVEGMTREQLTARLMQRYGIEHETAARDVATLVDDLEQRRLLAG